MSKIEALVTPEELDLAKLIVSTLGLEVAPQAIDPVAPLYKDGLGLDSIDILEVALAISKTYGFRMRSDDADNEKIFSSLRGLTEHVQKNRAK
jgi:acyl carrier protein